MLVAALALSVLAVACGKGDKSSEDQAGSQATATPQIFNGPTATATATTDEGVATPRPGPIFPPPRDDAELARLVISNAKINAPLQIKGVNARNEMENPDGKDNVAWYNFTARPGYGSNAVFSGHVDWYTGEKGVFWGLRDLKDGDEIMIKLSDGMDLKYRVTANSVYRANSAPVEEIVGSTDKDIVTLITCEGTFNRTSQDYSDRRVVRAERFE